MVSRTQIFFLNMLSYKITMKTLGHVYWYLFVSPLCYAIIIIILNLNAQYAQKVNTEVLIKCLCALNTQESIQSKFQTEFLSHEVT